MDERFGSVALGPVRIRQGLYGPTNCGSGTRTRWLEPFLGFGAKTVAFEYSTDGATWAMLEGVPEFARVPGPPGRYGRHHGRFAGVSARYVS